jgi:23S rRNA pseudouridine955/2504/2580 synthase
MIKMNVTADQHGMRLNKYLKEQMPELPHGIIFRTIRQKDVRINGKQARENIVLNAGDEVSVYLPLRYQEGTKAPVRVELDILYEDHHIILVNKQPGISVHPDAKTSGSTLIQQVQTHLEAKGETIRSKELPALCHRLDHHTGGIVIIAKTVAARDELLMRFRLREIGKFYQCIVSGSIHPPSGTLSHYLMKDEYASKVSVIPQSTPGALFIQTRYRTIRTGHTLSLLEVELLTGRTHQIRAHMSYIGHPILGDDKYGDRSLNRQYRIKTQQLWAYRIQFNFKSTGILDYLNHRTWTVENIPFASMRLD